MTSPDAFEVLSPGLLTTVQDWPGRIGFWSIGVPPSGPMDDRSFRLGNLALGNPAGAPGLECTLKGPVLRFRSEATIVIVGAEATPTIGETAAKMWEPVRVAAGAVLEVGAINGRGLRSYVLFAGGLSLPAYLGCAATFALGKFGGHHGRSLRRGDTLALNIPDVTPRLSRVVPPGERPELTHDWRLAVTEGPHGDAEFFTPADIVALYDIEWEVHFNSARTGVRLIGPRPEWARSDGGQAGMHPSNIHDTPYSVGAVNYTGDTPILLGPDGPSLGGFVCPATVTTEDRWKLGQLRPGDTVRFVREPQFAGWLSSAPSASDGDGGVISRTQESEGFPAVTYRRCGDEAILIEYGPMKLDLALRARVEVLADRIKAERLQGVLDLTAGVRGLQVQFDSAVLSPSDVVEMGQRLESELAEHASLKVSSRVIHMPLCWDDPETQKAVQRYMSGVRADAPWCPSNIEFIRRANGLASEQEVRQIVYDAEYLVLGLGDVYLGAPLAVPIDPRHRLVTTKYNPTRTWTPENAVGIGGSYLCIYGLEGPGGYQLIGRTIQIWSTDTVGPMFDEPWLLRNFDRIRWYPVSAEELEELRADFAAGRLELKTEAGVFDLGQHDEFLTRERESIEAFARAQASAFAIERAAWDASGELTVAKAPADGP